MKRHNNTEEVILISDERLGDIVRALLLNPDAAGEGMSLETHRLFKGLIADVVSDVCGGDVTITDNGVEVRPNDSSPEGGGIWSAVLPGQEQATALCP